MFSKEEIERIKRETGLPELAASCGYVMDEKASCRTSLVMRHHGNKIIVATGEDGHGIFFDVYGSASGSVIDFVMWQEGVNFGGACQILSERITGYDPTKILLANSLFVPAMLRIRTQADVLKQAL